VRQEHEQSPILDYAAQPSLQQRRSYWKLICIVLLPPSTALIVIAAGHGIATAAHAMLLLVYKILTGGDWRDWPGDLVLSTAMFVLAWLHLLIGTLIGRGAIAKAVLTTGFVFLAIAVFGFASFSDMSALTLLSALPALALATALLVQPFRRDLPAAKLR
jgi:hypothetical protein